MNSPLFPSASAPPEAPAAALFPTGQPFEVSAIVEKPSVLSHRTANGVTLDEALDGVADGATTPYADPADSANIGLQFDRDALYAEFAPLVRRLIRQYGDNVELRQDLAGEIYYRFCLLLDAYDPARGVPLRPYLVRQLSASIYTYARHHWRRARRETSLQLEDGGLCEPAQPADPTPQWDHALATEQVLKALPEAISGLPKRQRQVVIWRYYDQGSFEEIAGLLDVQVATARSLLRHGLNNLRRWVSNHQLIDDSE